MTLTLTDAFPRYTEFDANASPSGGTAHFVYSFHEERWVAR